jgi:glutaredoxin 3
MRRCAHFGASCGPSQCSHIALERFQRPRFRLLALCNLVVVQLLWIRIGKNNKSWSWTLVAQVEIYTRDYCGYCTRAKALLAGKGVAFTEYRAGDDAEKRREMIQRSHGGTTYPQVFINGQPVGGSDDIHDLDRHGQLDRLLAETAAAA